MTTTYQPRPGDIVFIRASAACHAMYALISATPDHPVWEGNVWLNVYRLNPANFKPVEKRMAYVPVASLDLIRSTEDRRAGRARIVRAAGLNERDPVRPIPRQRVPFGNERRTAWTQNKHCSASGSD